MNREFCDRLRQRNLLIGTIISIDSIAVMEILASGDLDWIFIEAEHAPIGMGALERLLVAAGTTPCLVRLPNHESTWIKRALDLGAAGIIVPQVNTVDEAVAIAKAARFTPHGNRGVGVSRANDYGYAVGDYINGANEGTAVMVQAEHVDAVANASAIAEVDGVDGVFVGPYDLSASMGLPGQLDHPDVNAAIDHICQAFTQAQKPAGVFSVDIDDAHKRIEQGFSFVACSLDVLLLRAGVTQLAAALRET
jgi:2-dehydro-3-deoxyglucarate aldolase